MCTLRNNIYTTYSKSKPLRKSSVVNSTAQSCFAMRRELGLGVRSTLYKYKKNTAQLRVLRGAPLDATAILSTDSQFSAWAELGSMTG